MRKLGNSPLVEIPISTCWLQAIQKSLTLTRSVHVGLHQYVDTTYTIQLYFFILVVAPVSHGGKVLSFRVVLFVALGQDDILV